MRVKVIILAAVAGSLVSCGKETIERRVEESAGIGFSTHLTRGSVIEDAAGVASAGGFSVWAYSHTGDWTSATDKNIIIDNTGSGYGQVTSSDAGATWEYGTPVVWPYGRKVSFFAYAPHGSAALKGADAQGVPVIEYEVPVATENQIDLMIASPVLNAKGPNPVGEVFHHALSRIELSAFKAAAMGEVRIKSVEFKGLCYKGLTTIQTPVSWTVDPAVRNYSFSVADGSLQDIVLSASVQNILAADGTMFLMPQTLDGSAGMTVTFIVDGVELSWSGAVPSTAAWLPGKSYDYQLFIDGDVVLVSCGSLESPVAGNGWGDF